MTMTKEEHEWQRLARIDRSITHARLRSICSARCYLPKDRRDTVCVEKSLACVDRDELWHVVLRDHDGGTIKRLVEAGQYQGKLRWRIDRSPEVEA